MKPPKAKKTDVADAAADELAEIEKKLVEVEADMRAIHFHRAEIRVSRMIFLAHSTRCGLRQQAGKLRGREHNEFPAA